MAGRLNIPGRRYVSVSLSFVVSMGYFGMKSLGVGTDEMIFWPRFQRSMMPSRLSVQMLFR